MWLNICLLPCKIYMSKFTRFPFPLWHVEPYCCTTLRMLDFSLSAVAICISLFNYACVMYALCYRIYVCTHTYTRTHRSHFVVFQFRKTMKFVSSRCKVNKANVFIVQQCPFFCVWCTLIARIALETYWQTIYQKDLNCYPPPNSSALWMAHMHT